MQDSVQEHPIVMIDKTVTEYSEIVNKLHPEKVFKRSAFYVALLKLVNQK